MQYWIDRCSGHVIRLALRHQRYFTRQAGCKKLTRDLLYCFRSCGLCPDWSCQDWSLVFLSFTFASFLASCWLCDNGAPWTELQIWRCGIDVRGWSLGESQDIICNIVFVSYISPQIQNRRRKKEIIFCYCIKAFVIFFFNDNKAHFPLIVITIMQKFISHYSVEIYVVTFIAM